MKTNAKALDHRKDFDNRTAGGFGPYAAKQSPEALLRRSVMANLLWEDNFYEDGKSSSDQISVQIPLVDPQTCFNIAVEARTQQKLRHVPLFLAVRMLRHVEHRKLVGDLLPQIIKRADELTEFLALYWEGGKVPLAKQAKLGLAQAFHNFDAYQFAKYNRDEKIKLRDVLFLVHPKPKNQEQEILFKQIAENSLPVPDTWEVALSTGKDKKKTWTRLIQEKKLGALAFLRNLQNMEKVEIPSSVILEGFQNINPSWLLPINFFGAAKAAPKWEREIETLMYKCLAKSAKLSGHTVLIIDVSGSMESAISSKSIFGRLDVAGMLAIVAGEICERVSIYCTAGNDCTRVHQTRRIPPRRGFALVSEIGNMQVPLGGGGIFTRQCLEYIKTQEREQPERIIVFSDSQDCDDDRSRIPAPFGKHNYIVDVSAHKHGIAYQGIWTAEISGWSERFLEYIMAFEGLNLQEEQMA